MSKKIDIINKKFGFLTVIKEVDKTIENRTTYLCKCDCGLINCRKTTITTGKRLRNGGVKGCRARAHGHNDVENVKNATYKILFRQNYSDGDLILEDFIKLINCNCYYCGAEPNNYYNGFKRERKELFSNKNGDIKYNGLDRINSNQLHNLNNVVPCCIHCNEYKLTDNYEIFLNKINSLNENFNPIYIKDINFIKDLIKEYNITGKCKNTRAKTILGKLFPGEYKNKIGSVISRKVQGFISRAYKNNIPCFLSNIDIAELMLANCIYCNNMSDINNSIFNTIDRYHNFDLNGNKTGYTQDNCVSACMNCNCAKRQLSVEDFRSWIVRIKNNLSNLPTTEKELIKYISQRKLYEKNK